jgi:hypothetical protein
VHHSTPLASSGSVRSSAPQSAGGENVFSVLAGAGRRLSFGELAAIAAVSGVAALAAAAIGRASWLLLAACYVAWSFAGWGIMFHDAAPSRPRTRRWRAFQWMLVGSATAVFTAFGVGLFFWALGPAWKL